jgi:cAMP-dependent protein kinase regulator
LDIDLRLYFLLIWCRKEDYIYLYSSKNAYGEESDEDEEEEEVEELDSKKNSKPSQNFRTSVSAEAYGQFNKKGNYKPKEIPKTKSQIERIKTRLSQAFMFSSLEERDQLIVIGAFEEKNFK